jgi:hypothetical protein
MQGSPTHLLALLVLIILLAGAYHIIVRSLARQSLRAVVALCLLIPPLGFVLWLIFRFRGRRLLGYTCLETAVIGWLVWGFSARILLLDRPSASSKVEKSVQAFEGSAAGSPRRR